jgi:hypothetical protein
MLIADAPALMPAAAIPKANAVRRSARAGMRLSKRLLESTGTP